jgi:cytochrome c biogenesis protein CcmG/thiol:disulfide interchange protein DsbE
VNVNVNEAIPATTVVDLEDHPHDLRALTAGQPTILSLWATWCESCAEEFAPLNRLHDRTQREGRILAIAVGETSSHVRSFAAQKTLRYPIYLDPDFALANALGSQKVPTTFVLDRDGRIVHRGALFDPTALAIYRKLLETRTTAKR